MAGGVRGDQLNPLHAAPVLRWLLVLFLFAAGAASSADAPPVPPLKARVTDLTRTLSPEQQSALEAQLREFEQRKGSQLTVLLVPSTAPESIEQYAIRVAEAWKIGRKSADDGLILVVAKDDRTMRVEVGRGLEGAIPDVLASRVIREVITPRFQAGDFYGGITAGTQTLMKLIEGESLPAPAGRASGKSPAGDFQSVFVLVLLVSIFVGGMLSRLMGRSGGAFVTGGIVGIAAWAITGALLIGIVAGVAGLILTVIAAAGGAGRHGGWGGGGFGGGRWGGGGGWSGGGGGGWSGGGGTFGGGGASGRW
jgi:uncharacterized protein